MIKPTLYRKPLAGKSKSHIIQFSDGQDYVVKFFRPGFDRVLPNEWIGYCLARFLSLPIPYSQLVSIPKPFLADIWASEDVVYTSNQFATLYIPNSMNLRQLTNSQADVKSIVNSEAVAGMIVLDYWLNNRDRNRNNVLVSEVEPGSYRFWMIDQGDLFGACNSTAEQLQVPQMELYSSVTHKWMAQFIETEHAFEQYLEVIQTIPKLLLEEILTMVPGEWGISDEDRETIVQWLLLRRDKQLKQLIHRFTKSVYRSSQSVHI